MPLEQIKRMVAFTHSPNKCHNIFTKHLFLVVVDLTTLTAMCVCIYIYIYSLIIRIHTCNETFFFNIYFRFSVIMFKSEIKIL